MYRADIRITLRPSILDPQGKAVQHALAGADLGAVTAVRMGKLAELHIDTDDRDEAVRVARTACERLLANPVMEDFAIEIVEMPAITPVP